MWMIGNLHAHLFTFRAAAGVQQFAVPDDLIVARCPVHATWRPLDKWTNLPPVVARCLPLVQAVGGRQPVDGLGVVEDFLWDDFAPIFTALSS